MPPSLSTDDGYSRRRFIAVASLIPAFTVAPSLLRAAVPLPSSTTSMNVLPKKIPIGLELYSVRTELARDLPTTLQRVARMGYEAVEFYAPYYAWTMPYAKDVRRLLDDLGLRCLSTHNHIESFVAGEGLGKAIELNQILGTRQIVLSSAPRGTAGVEGWKKLCGQLTTVVQTLQPHGLTAGFHNHQTEWARLEGGERVMDLLAASTPDEFVLQLDVGTCVEGGGDPVAWIRAHPGRIKSIHLKDWAPGAGADEKGYRVLFGEGVSPWSAIIEAAESVGGVEVYLMEQEGSRFSEFETSERCLDAWKALRGRT